MADYTEVGRQHGSCYHSARVSHHLLSALHSSVMGRCNIAPEGASIPDVGTDNMADTNLARCDKVSNHFLLLIF